MPTSKAATELHGVVLAVHNAGEANRVVHLFDRAHGRVGVWARNARGSRKRLAGVLEPFYTLRVTAVAQGALYNLHQAEIVRDRPQIRQSFAAIARAANLCNLVRAAWPEHQAAADVFTGLEVALDHLAAGRLARAAGLYPRLAEGAGLLPNLAACSRCGTELPPGCLSDGEPAAYCLTCAPKRTPATPELWAALRGYRIENEAVANAVESTVLRWLSSHVGRAMVPWGQKPC